MSNKIKYVILEKSPLNTKKYRMNFFDKYAKYIKHTDFGAVDMEDLTIHKSALRKRLFLSRFNKLIKENEKDPTSAMTLSHLILWNKPSLEDSLEDYKKRFNIEKDYNIQSIYFPKDKWDLKKAVMWLSKRGLHVDLDETDNLYRFRQREPEKNEDYKTLILPNKVHIVIAK